MQLIRLVQSWSSALDASQYVATVFFDLKKAFDRVWHQGLLAKLAAVGVSGDALLWFKTIYLTGNNVFQLVEPSLIVRTFTLVFHKARSSVLSSSSFISMTLLRVQPKTLTFLLTTPRYQLWIRILLDWLFVYRQP